jgi:hypothetical protein
MSMISGNKKTPGPGSDSASEQAPMAEETETRDVLGSRSSDATTSG